MTKSHRVRMWMARADCSLKKKQKKTYSDMKKNHKKHIGLCRVSIHVVFVK